MDNRKQKMMHDAGPSGGLVQAYIPGIVLEERDPLTSPDVVRVLEFDRLVVMTLSVMAPGRRVTAKGVCRLALRLMGIRETEIGDALGERMARLCGPEHIRSTQEMDDERLF
jgi:hypothetical protein